MKIVFLAFAFISSVFIGIGATTPSNTRFAAQDAQVAQKQLDMIQQIFNKTYNYRKWMTLIGVNFVDKFSDVGNVAFTYSGITHRNDLKEKLSDLFTLINIPEEKQRLIMPIREINELNYLFGSSISNGDFEFSYVHYSHVDTTMEHFTVSACRFTGSIYQFPNVYVDVLARDGIYERADSRVKQLLEVYEKIISLEEFQTIFSIILQPVVEMAGIIVPTPPPSLASFAIQNDL